MLFTTTVAITRRAGTGDPYEADAASALAESMPAHVSSPSESDSRIGGAQEHVEAVLLAPPTPALQRADTITDLATGDVWTAIWQQQRHGLGLDHQRVGLSRTKGAADG